MTRQEPQGFPEFWGIWRPHARHTDGRGQARETFARHVKNGADPQDIIDGARCFFRTMKEKDRDYVPLAATWLNRGAYEDLAEQERVYASKRVTRPPAIAPQAVTEARDEAMIARIRKLREDAVKGMTTT